MRPRLPDVVTRYFKRCGHVSVLDVTAVWGGGGGTSLKLVSPQLCKGFSVFASYASKVNI